jgi:hypothetical protein
MAMWIYPSSDIHLVTATGSSTPPPATADIRILLQFPNGLNGAWTDASTIAGMRTRFIQLGAPAGTAGVQHAIPELVGDDTRDPANPLLPPPAQPATISRSAMVGASFHIALSFIQNQPTSTERGLLRVTTHDDVDRLIAGDRSLSTFAGESNLVLTTYAHFTDRAADVLDDVTGHPWLKVKSLCLCKCVTGEHGDRVGVQAAAAA